MKILSWLSIFSILLLSIGLASAYNGDFCTQTHSPCGGGCTSTDLSAMYDSYDFGTDSLGVGDITGWDTSCITNMSGLFAVSNFNQPIGGWNVSSVTDMSSMFDSTPFNQDISNWDTSNVLSMEYMFTGTTAFNQNLENWTFCNVLNYNGMFNGVTLSTYNYDRLLCAMDYCSAGGITFDGGNSKYSNVLYYSSPRFQAFISGQICRDDLLNNGWISITDGGFGYSPGLIYYESYDDVTDYNFTGGTVAPAYAYNTTNGFEAGRDSYALPFYYSLYTLNTFTTFPNYSYIQAANIIDAGGGQYYGQQGIGFYNGTTNEAVLFISPDVTDLSWPKTNFKLYLATDADSYSTPLITANCPSISGWIGENINIALTSTNTFNVSMQMIDLNTSAVLCYGETVLTNANIELADNIRIASKDGHGGGPGYDFDEVTLSEYNYTTPPPVCDLCTESCSPCGGGCTATDLSGMYSGYDFDTDAYGVGNISGWNTSCITSMNSLFAGSNFNQNIDSWNTSNVLNTASMFQGDTVFNQPLNNWDVSKVTEAIAMFQNSAFNQPLNNWNTSSLLYAGYMFYGTGFDQNISSWNVTSLLDMTNTFYGDTLSLENYDALLNGWSSQSLQSSVAFDAGNSKYTSTGSPGRDILMNTYSWGISDGGSVICSETHPPCVSTNGCAFTDLSNMYFNVVNFNATYGDITGWNTSCITNMGGMFTASDFNQNISSWDVSHVTDMNGMFYNTQFNQDISSWNTSSVLNMNSMFFNTLFNQPIGSWDVSQVTDMGQMFAQDTAFNQNLSAWNIVSLTNAASMFLGDTLSINNYDALLNGWVLTANPFVGVVFDGGNSHYSNVGKVARENLTNTIGWTITDAGSVLCSEAYPPCTQGGCVNTDLTSYFQNYDFVTDGNNVGNISGWDTSCITNMNSMFLGSNFNQNINNWNTSAVTDMSNMFYNDALFDQPLNNWDVSAVTNMQNMFSISGFNQNISSWNTSSVTSMGGMFGSNLVFNQPIINWDTSNVQYMNSMFEGDIAFNQNLENWSIISLSDATNMFNGARLSEKNYDSLLNGWSIQAVQSGVPFSGGNSKYTPVGQAGRDTLTNNYTWSITDAGPAPERCTEFNSPCGGGCTVTDFTGMFTNYNFSEDYSSIGNISGWNTSCVTSTNNMFSNSDFNQDIGSWDTSSVTDMGYMFFTTPFNQNISGWNTANVLYMNDMFHHDNFFNQSIGNWDVSQVTTMFNMFNNAFAFDQNLSTWNTGQVLDMTGMFFETSLSTPNYDSLLNGWATYTQQMNVIFDAGDSHYSVNGIPGRDTLRLNYSWRIIDEFAYPGNGTQADPFNISTCDELHDIDLDSGLYWQIVNNLECYGLIYDSFIGEYTFLSEFNGSLDGQGYNISNLLITSSDNNFPATMFSTLNGNVTNLNLYNARVSTSVTSSTSSIIANINNGFISNINLYNSTTIGTRGNKAIVAANNYGTINNVTFNGIINLSSGASSTLLLEGITVVNYGTIDSVIFNGTYYVNYGTYIISSPVGMIARDNYRLITSSKFIGAVTQVGTKGIPNLGGIVAVNQINGTIYNTSFTGTLTGTPSGALIVGGIAGTNYGTIEASDFTGAIITTSGTSGSYLGGIAAYNYGGNITDVRFNGNITTTMIGTNIAVGGIIGRNFQYLSHPGIINQSYSSGTITWTPTSTITSGYAGGIIGLNIAGDSLPSEGQIYDSHSTMNINGSSNTFSTFCGGFAGRNGGIIARSSATGNVNCKQAAGFTTFNAGGNISESYATGNSIAFDTNAAGFVGNNQGLISDCYSTGNSNVTKLVGGVYVYGNQSGGFVYANGISGTGTIINSYSTGISSGQDNGFIRTSSGTVTDSFWDTNTSGKTTSFAATGKTTDEMKTQSTFTNWDFNNTWTQSEFVNNNYPILLNNNEATLTIIFSTGTPSNGARFPADVDSIYINTTNNANISTTTIDLYNATSYNTTALVNSINATEYNFTGLGNGLYYFNASIIDDTNTTAHTETRNVGLGCIENWVQDTHPACFQLDNYTKTYTDTNMCNTTILMPPDNGTTTTCQYINISTCTQLQAINNNATALAGNYKVTNNFTCNGVAYVPIGTIATPFTGTFDGQGYTIDRISSTATAISYKGMFGASTGIIANFILAGPRITTPSGTNSYFGTVAGWSSGTIKNIIIVRNPPLLATIAIVKPYAGASIVGGLVGYNSGTIDNCTSTADVGITSSAFALTNAGGLVGINNGTIINSTSSSVVDTGGSNTGHFYGGFVGTNDINGNIINCSATGNVHTRWDTGGFVSVNSGNISNSYSTGVSTSRNAGSYAGGFARSNSGVITNSYSTGQVNNDENAITAGFIGINTGIINNSYAAGPNTGFGGFSFVSDNSGTIDNSYATGSATNGFADINSGTCTNSYWNTQTAGIDSRCGEGKTSAELRNESTYIGWDFNNTWSISRYVNQGYPALIGLPNAGASCSVCTEYCSPCGGGCTATDMTSMYSGYDFIADVSGYGNFSGWNTSCVTSMSHMFESSNFNQDISNWDTSSVTSLSYMFFNDGVFNQNIGGWNTQLVNDMSFMFYNDAASAFNQPIGNWDTLAVNNMESMFFHASSFNQNITGWQVVNVVNMNSMFIDASAFNQDISLWNPLVVTNMNSMFSGATSFDQNLGVWNIAQVADMNNMFNGVALSTSNYDSLLNGWSAQAVQSSVPFSAGNSQYSSVGKPGRDTLTGTYGWSITDGGTTTLFDCSTIPLPGTYDITNSFGVGGVCITVQANDVTINGNGYTITGAISADGYTGLVVKDIIVSEYVSVNGLSGNPGAHAGIVNITNSTILGDVNAIGGESLNVGGAGGTINIFNSTVGNIFVISPSTGSSASEAGTVNIYNSTTQNINGYGQDIGAFKSNGGFVFADNSVVANIDVHGGGCGPSFGTNGTGGNITLNYSTYGTLNSIGCPDGIITIYPGNVSGCDSTLSSVPCTLNSTYDYSVGNVTINFTTINGILDHDDIATGSNWVFVSSGSAANVPATITFDNIPNITTYIPYKDGKPCTTECSDIHTEGSKLIFNVTGFSNYTYGYNVTYINSCGFYDANYTTYVINTSVSYSSGDCIHFAEQSPNVHDIEITCSDMNPIVKADSLMVTLGLAGGGDQHISNVNIHDCNITDASGAFAFFGSSTGGTYYENMTVHNIGCSDTGACVLFTNNFVFNFSPDYFTNVDISGIHTTHNKALQWGAPIVLYPFGPNHIMTLTNVTFRDSEVNSNYLDGIEYEWWGSPDQILTGSVVASNITNPSELYTVIRGCSGTVPSNTINTSGKYVIQTSAFTYVPDPTPFGGTCLLIGNGITDTSNIDISCDDSGLVFVDYQSNPWWSFFNLGVGPSGNVANINNVSLHDCNFHLTYGQSSSAFNAFPVLLYSKFENNLATINNINIYNVNLTYNPGNAGALYYVESWGSNIGSGIMNNITLHDLHTYNALSPLTYQAGIPIYIDNITMYNVYGENLSIAGGFGLWSGGSTITNSEIRDSVFNIETNNWINQFGADVGIPLNSINYTFYYGITGVMNDINVTTNADCFGYLLIDGCHLNNTLLYNFHNTGNVTVNFTTINGILNASDIQGDNDWVYVNNLSAANVPAHINFNVPNASVVPFRDGEECNATYCSNITNNGTNLQFNVIGFSNYSYGVGACIENWVQQTPACYNAFNYTVVYIDTNSCGTNTSLPPNNGTTANCTIYYPNVTTFDGSTSYFQNLTNQGLETFYGLILENTSNGKVAWNNITNVSAQDFDTNFQILPNLISVNTPALNPTINTSANISVYNIFIVSPWVFKDGIHCTDCNIISNNGSTIEFSVPGFTDYTLGNCTENWVPIGEQVCNGTVPSYTITYNDTNMCNTTYTLPANNGTTVSCAQISYTAGTTSGFSSGNTVAVNTNSSGNYTIINIYNSTGSVIATNLNSCFQNLFNQNVTGCGLNTGTYTSTGTFDPAHPATDGYDGNYSTYAQPNATFLATIYANASIPYQATRLSELNLVTYSNFGPGVNVSVLIEDDCWIYPTLQLAIEMYNDVGIHYVYPECYNGTSWNILTIDQSSNHSGLYEMGMQWIIANGTSLNTSGLGEGAYYYNATTVPAIGDPVTANTQNVTLIQFFHNASYMVTFPYTNNFKLNSHNLVVPFSTIDPYYNRTIYHVRGITNLSYNINATTTGTTHTYVLPDGQYYYSLTIFDEAGNNQLYDPNITIDTTPPVITYQSGTEAANSYIGFNRTNITVNITVSDLYLNLTTINLYNGTGALIDSYTGTFNQTSLNKTFTGLTDGVYRFNVTATDEAGNNGYSTTRTVTIITSFKEGFYNITYNYPNDYSIANSTITPISFTTTDPYYSFAAYNMSGTIVNTAALTYTWTLGEGIYNYNVKIFDLAGNSKVYPTQNITVDGTAPSVTYALGTEADNSYIGNNRTTLIVNILVTDLHLNTSSNRINLYDSGFNLVAQVNGTNGTIFNNVTAGVYYFNASSTDTLNHTGFAPTRTVTVIPVFNSANYTVTFVYPNNATITNATFNAVNFTTTDAYYDHVLYELERQPSGYNTFESTTRQFKNYTVPLDGLYKNYLTIYDKAGNSQVYIQFITVSAGIPTTDYSPPTEADNSYINRTDIKVNLSINASNNVSTILVKLYNSTMNVINTSNTQYTDFTGLAKGVYYFDGVITDTFGYNVSALTRKVTIIPSFDNTTYNVTFPTPNNALIGTSTFPGVNFTTTDPYYAYAIYNISGALTNTTAKNFAFTVADGYYVYNVRIYDLAGNSQFYGSRNITVDATAPVMFYLGASDADNSYKPLRCFGPNCYGYVEAFVALTDPHPANSRARLYSSNNITLLMYKDLGTNYTDPDYTAIAVFGADSGTVPPTLNLSSGIYFYDATATDALGHTTTLPRRKVTIITAFSTGSYTMTFPNVNNAYVRSSNFTAASFTTVDPYYNFATYSIQGITNVSYGYNVTTSNKTYVFTNIPDGKYYYAVTLYDLAGNNNYYDPNITLDTTPPTITFTNNSDPAYVYQRPYLYIETQAIDANLNYTNISVYNNTGLVASFVGNSSITNFTTANLTDGFYNITAIAYDLVGQNATINMTIELDYIKNAVQFRAAEKITDAQRDYNITFNSSTNNFQVSNLGGSKNTTVNGIPWNIYNVTITATVGGPYYTCNYYNWNATNNYTFPDCGFGNDLVTVYAYNSYTITPISGFTTTLKTGAYNETQTATNTTIVYTLLHGLNYTLNFTQPLYLNNSGLTAYVSNGTGLTANTINQSMNNTRITLNFKRAFTGTLINDSTITINDALNNKTFNTSNGTLVFNPVAGTINFTMIATGDTISQPFTLVTSNAEIGSRDILLYPILELEIYDEQKSLLNQTRFNFASPDLSTLTIYCTSPTAFTISVTIPNSTNGTYFAPAPCIFNRIRFDLAWDNIAGSPFTYYRTLTFPASTELFNISVYLVDAFTTATDLTYLKPYDIFGIYTVEQNTQIQLYEIFPTGNHLITSDYVDAEGKMSATLMAGGQYIITVSADDATTRTLGPYYADTAGTKILRLFDVTLTGPPQGELGTQTTVDTANNTVKMRFVDTNLQTQSVTLALYGASCDTPGVFQTIPLIMQTISNTTLYTGNGEYIMTYNVPNGTSKYYTASNTTSFCASYNRTDMSGNVQVVTGTSVFSKWLRLPAQFKDPWTFPWIVMLLLIVIALGANARTAAPLSLIIAIAASGLYAWNWIATTSIPGVMPGIALGVTTLIAILFNFKRVS